jgi:glycosyltransferase involved in cell wall biosynthesis
VAFRAERALLQAAGVEVRVFTRENDAIGPQTGERLRTALDGLWSRQIYREMQREIDDFRPELVHCHGLFPLVSSSAYSACRSRATPVVQTLHNYRMICPNGLLLRDAQPCEDCVGRLPIGAVRHRCYRDSRTASIAAAAISVNTFHLASRTVARFIALTRFAAGVFERAGLSRERIVVRPNCLAADPAARAGGRGGYVLFAGRLSTEKGVSTLLRAWHHEAGLPECIVVGDGPLRGDLESQVRENRLNVRFLGARSRADVLDLMREAAAVAIPSICYEGLPMVFLEAMACGTPVVCSRIGGLTELVVPDQNGQVHAAGDHRGLADGVRRIIQDDQERSALRDRCRAVYDQRYSTTQARDRLLAIYDEVLAQRSN